MSVLLSVSGIQARETSDGDFQSDGETARIGCAENEDSV